MEEQPNNGTGADKVESTPAIGSAGAFVPLTQLQRSGSDRLDIGAIRQKLQSSTGRQYWRSLEEVAGTPAFQTYLEKEFPHQAPREYTPLARRDFLRLMGATLALAGVGGCAYQPAEKIVPYIEQPENLVPGKPLFYTSTFTRDGYGIGILGESTMGRPIKLEGNPDHPASLGATDAFTQASLLGLYDPDRSQTVRNGGDVSSWENFEGITEEHFERLRKNGGTGLRLLIGPSSSPTLAAQITRFQKSFPNARIHTHAPAGREGVLAGAKLAFGRELEPVYHFDRATTIVSLDADFLLEEPGSVRYARDFINGRLVREGKTEMNRLYVIESTASITGAKADHRFPAKPSAIFDVAREIAAAASAGVAGMPGAKQQSVPSGTMEALIADLKAAPGTSLVLAGPHMPAEVHALCFAINSALGNIGKTVTFHEPVLVRPTGDPSLKSLVAAMNKGQVTNLLILGCNPVYDAPADLSFKVALGKVNFRLHMGLYDDETGVECHWHLPASHYLETWSDARSYDGTASIIQPLITPLYATRSLHEVLAWLNNSDTRAGYDLVRSHWQTTSPSYAPRPADSGDTASAMGALTSESAIAEGERNVAQSRPRNAAFEKFWHQLLIKGTVPNSASAPIPVTTGAGFTAAMPAGRESGGDELVFRPDPTIWDGAFANNAWLQELPKPLTKLTWDNAAMISPKMAERLKAQNGDLLSLEYKGRKMSAAAWILPGHADGAVTLTLGYGRTRAGKVGTGTGFNAYELRTADHPGFDGGLKVEKAGGNYSLVSAQQHFNMEGRDLIKVGTLAGLKAHPDHPDFMSHGVHIPEGETPSLYNQDWPSDRKDPGAKGPGVWESKDRAYNDLPIPAWGMVIDGQACIGCNACTIACQAENNIATVGKDQVANNREMHWIRIDTYFEGSLDNPETLFQPLPCQHCEKAPCEPVCPVEATSHSAEGINEMTYNRCIGTRYCENNCPYKVRRFNYLQYSDQKTPTIQMMQNPDVTVRSRGVMEKCTYCVQRVNEARIEAEKESRPIRDGDVKSACQQVCPTNAILFGDLNDKTSNGGKGSKVRQMKGTALDYTVLGELNTRPRTSYLAAVRNPNSANDSQEIPGGGHSSEAPGTPSHGAPSLGAPANGSTSTGTEGH